MKFLEKRRASKEEQERIRREEERKRQKIEALKNKIKRIFFWIIAGFLGLLSLPFLNTFGGILLLLSAVLVAPIDKIQNVVNVITDEILFKKHKNPRVLKGLIIALVAVFGIIFAGASTETPAEPAETTAIVLETELPTIETTIAETTVATTEATTEATEEPTTEATTEPTQAITEPTEAVVALTTDIPENSTFEIHFIDVGQADSALVLCDGNAMLIDGGNSADSSLIYSYLKNHNITYLNYIVATHGHEDHVGGLAGALNYANVGTAFCSVDYYDSEAFSDFVKYLNEKGEEITIPEVGKTFNLGSAVVEIIGVDPYADDPNNTSIVLRITYGETSFIFTGDAEREAEQAILNSGYNLKSTVLKVGHHGSENSTTYPFLREIMPEYAVISVGQDNNYGHPTEEALSRLRDADVKVYRTDLQGHIICVSDGKQVSFTVERNADIDTIAIETEPPETTAPATEAPAETEPEVKGTEYLLNTNTRKFHYLSCGSGQRTKEKNRAYFTGTREEVIAKGYQPCGNCDP